ncbi:hypothetical protein EIP91_005969 [Steccherinum ochraceum]|uniref:Uncharacterized protein n=1 Tax=Steccherinum ochraceum TaxID=92696 RepID=A0A4R0R6H5_9APHY|nr:hypothetical protein EIP91_005969 [Steccherinum ochraceum]
MRFLCSTLCLRADEIDGCSVHSAALKLEPKSLPPHCISEVDIRVDDDVATVLSLSAAAEDLFIEVDIQMRKALRTMHVVLRPSLRETLGRLRHQWQELYKSFHTLSWLARELAGRAQAVISDFTQVCLARLRDPEVAIQSKATELRDYRQTLSHNETAWGGYNEQLAEFMDRLHRFERDLKEITVKHSNVARCLLLKVQSLRIVIEGAPLEKEVFVQRETVDVPSLLQKCCPTLSHEIHGSKYDTTNFVNIRFLNQDAEMVKSLHFRGLQGLWSALTLLAVAVPLEICSLESKFELLPTSQDLLETIFDLNTMEHVYSSLLPFLHAYQVSVVRF